MSDSESTTRSIEDENVALSDQLLALKLEHNDALEALLQLNGRCTQLEELLVEIYNSLESDAREQFTWRMLELGVIAAPNPPEIEIDFEEP